MVKMERANDLIYWDDLRDELMPSAEQAECDEWLAELSNLMDARDAGKITLDEYCALCFELDKKYGIATDDDAERYLDIDAEENFPARISANA